MTIQKVKIQLGQLAGQFGAQLTGDAGIEITGINTIQDAGPTEICFLSSPRHAPKLAASKAAAVLTKMPVTKCRMAQVVVGNVDKALIAMMTVFAPRLTPQNGIHPSAAVEPDACVDPSASIGPGAYIGHGVKIGPRTHVGPNSSIGENSQIGADCRLDANVAVYHNCKIGNACVIQANSTIGSTGFGYSFIDGRHQLIPHNGGVILEDGVEIGANTCIDRAKFGNTIIGAGTKIDNLVQIAHNVIIGKACLLAGQAAVAGRTRLGDGVVLGGRAGASDNLDIGSGVMAGASSTIIENIQPGRKVWGTPAIDMLEEMKSVVIFKKLPIIVKEVKALAKRVERLEAAKDNKG